jgi:hypothetical protein
MSTEHGTLHVLGPYEITELRVFDGNMDLVATGTQSLHLDLKPGIYRVQAQIPGDHTEALAVVRAGRDATVQNFTLNFDSATPLQSARTVHEYHHGPAVELSNRLHYTYQPVGSVPSAALFIFARSSGDGRPMPPPFSIRTRAGTTVCEFPTSGQWDGDRGWLALSLELPPATYILEYEVPELGPRGQAIFVEDGWQTQLFAPWGTVPEFARGATYMYPRGQGFVASGSFEYSRVEAALDGLARGRLVLPEPDLTDLLNGKFTNPMLGLIGAYALLGQPEVDYVRLQVVAQNLRALLPHSADANLISLVANLGGQTVEPAVPSGWPPFDEPPVFAVGTERAVQLAASSDELCPIDSWLTGIAPRRTAGSAWTCWETQTTESEVLGPVEAELRRLSREAAHLSAAELARIVGMPLSVVRAALEPVGV